MSCLAHLLKEKPTHIHILICDDDPMFAEQLRRLLRACPLPAPMEIAFHVATDPSSLSDEQLAQVQLAFLDVDMQPMNGLALARRLRTLQPRAIVILVTNFVEYAPEGYELQIFRYLLKSDLEEKLQRYYTQALRRLQKKETAFSFRLNGETIAVDIRNVIYVEAALREVVLHQHDRDRPVFRFYRKLSDLEEQLAPHGFLRVHKSYLVSPRWVKQLRHNGVRLTDGTELPVSQSRYAQLRQQYEVWRRGQL